MIFIDANFLINYYVETNKDHERALGYERNKKRCLYGINGRFKNKIATFDEHFDLNKNIKRRI